VNFGVKCFSRFMDGSKHHPMATEDGHSDFAAKNARQDLLVAYLRKICPDHVSCERIL
jgi:glucokinase